MIETIHGEAEALRAQIEAETIGFEGRFLGFVRDYTADAQLERAAVLVNLRLGTAAGDARAAVKREMLDLIGRVLDGYSAVDLKAKSDRREQAAITVAKTYLQRSTLVLDARGISKAFGKAFRLGPLDLSIRRGEITGVVGENGNGKTTLFRLIAGELGADAGELRYPAFGQPGRRGRWRGRIDWPLVKSRIAYVPQELPPWRGNLKEILQYEAAIHGIRGTDNDDEVDFVVERLGLGEHLHKRWQALSGGFKFRFALARALVWRPTLMVLDEPLANLDVNAQLAVLRDIQRLATNVAHPMAVLMSSQHLHEVEAIADALLFLDAGQPLFNDRRDRLGQDRDRNTFELGCPWDLRELQRAIGDAFPVRIANDGLGYVLATERGVDARRVLSVLLAAGAEVQYFRDISRSSKQIFQSLR